MKFKSIKLLLFTFLIVSFVLTGCQPLGNSGIDLNKVLTNEYIPPESYEMKQSISLEFDYDETMIDKKNLNYYQLFDNSKIDLYAQVKGTDLYIDGVISVYRGEIPFKLSLTGDQLVIWPDNAEKPLVLVGTEYEEMREEMIAELGFDPFDTTSVEYQQYEATILDIVDFTVNNLPNPDTISYDLNSATTINDQEVRMTKIDSTIYATELPGLSIDFLNNVKSDRTLKEIMKAIYTAYGEEIMGEQIGTPTEINLFVDEMYQYIIQLIDQTIVQIEEMEAQGFTDDYKDSYFKTTLYVDNSLRIKKANNTLSFQVPELLVSDFEGITAFEINTSYELFNENGDFDFQTIDITGTDYLTTESDDKDLFKSLNKQGVFFDILKKDFRLIPDKTFTLTLNKKEVKITNYMDEVTNTSLNVSPYSKNGTTLVPIRFISENMGANVAWDKNTQKVTITKGDTTIVLTVGNKVALVNGEELPLSAVAEIKDGSVMVPLRFISDAFNADINWEPETKTITIKQYE